MGAGMPMFKIASTIEPLEKNVRISGYCLSDLLLHFPHVLKAAAPVVILQLHLDGGGVGPGVGGVQRREIRHHADVGNHQLEIAADQPRDGSEFSTLAT